MKEYDTDNKNYDKIRHLVEVDDDILAVFIMVSSQMKELYIAENSRIDKNYVDSIIVPALGLNLDTCHRFRKTTNRKNTACSSSK